MSKDSNKKVFLKIINDYIEAYNQSNVKDMVKDFDLNIVFENIENNQSTLILKGLSAFTEQAQIATTYFKERKQHIKSSRQLDQLSWEIEIEYVAVLAVDFPNGAQKGQQIKLVGKSIFEFTPEGKITKLTDIT